MALIDNLVAYWSLDEASGNAIDAHGSNDLTDNNTVGSTTGKVGNARDFEVGDSEYFTRADNTDLSTGNIDFTFTAWVQVESKGADRVIISKFGDSAGTNREYLLRFIDGSDRFEFWVYDSGGHGDAVANNLGSPSLATWYFIVAWHDATANTVNIQVNNGTADSAAWTTGVLDGTGAFGIGALDNGGFTQFFDGLIDEVGFWKRVLTSDEKTELYNAGNGRDYAYISGGGDPFINFSNHGLSGGMGNLSGGLS